MTAPAAGECPGPHHYDVLTGRYAEVPLYDGTDRAEAVRVLKSSGSDPDACPYASHPASRHEYCETETKAVAVDALGRIPASFPW